MASAVGCGLSRSSNGFEQDVHRAEVRRVRVQDQRLTGDADRMRDARAVFCAISSMRAMRRSVRSTEAASGSCTLTIR